MKKFKEFNVTHIPRVDNTKTDGLPRVASLKAYSQQNFIVFQTFHKHRIFEFKLDNGTQILSLKEILPINKEEAQKVK